MTTNIVIAVIIWLLTFVGSVWAIVLALAARPRHLRWSACLAITASLVSTMGLTAWTPFGFFPEVGYTWSNGSLEVSIRSGWLFVAPLMLGSIALLLALWKRSTQN